MRRRRASEPVDLWVEYALSMVAERLGWPVVAGPQPSSAMSLTSALAAGRRKPYPCLLGLVTRDPDGEGGTPGRNMHAIAPDSKVLTCNAHVCTVVSILYRGFAHTFLRKSTMGEHAHYERQSPPSLDVHLPPVSAHTLPLPDEAPTPHPPLIPPDREGQFNVLRCLMSAGSGPRLTV
jgi:hypothetical protein